MASINERNGRFMARVRRDGYSSVTKSFLLKRDAIAWARSVESDMEAGRWVNEADRVPTLAEAIGLYEKTVAVNQKGRKDYAYRFAQMAAETFAGKSVAEVTSRDLALWRDRQAREVGPATVVRKMAMLSSVLTWCMKERSWITENPLSRVRRPRMPEGRDRTLTPDEFGWLMAAARTSKATWLPHALTALSRSAMRRGELFSLKRADVDYSACIAHLSDTKNGSSRDVPLCPESLAALKELDALAAAAGVVELLPVGSVGSVSTRFTQTVRRARALYEQDCATTGRECSPDFLADVHLHDLRHCAASYWAAQGLGLIELAAITGHRTPRMVMRYAHIQASALAAKLGKLAA
jgi:integrase